MLQVIQSKEIWVSGDSEMGLWAIISNLSLLPLLDLQYSSLDIRFFSERLRGIDMLLEMQMGILHIDSQTVRIETLGLTCTSEPLKATPSDTLPLKRPALLQQGDIS